MVQSWQADEAFKTRFDKLDARLARVDGIEPLRLTLKGRFLIDWAWEARTNVFALSVIEPQFEAFHHRLVEASQTLEAAYKLNPRQSAVAHHMVTVELGDGGDRDTMELRFKRALELNPNNKHACLEKLIWLEPKWHGDPEGKEMLEFGRACAATGNWVGGIILVQADAMINYAACNLTGAEYYRFSGAPRTGPRTLRFLTNTSSITSKTMKSSASMRILLICRVRSSSRTNCLTAWAST